VDVVRHDHECIKVYVRADGRRAQPFFLHDLPKPAQSDPAVSGIAEEALPVVRAERHEIRCG
jgi:hypothetical protein